MHAHGTEAITLASDVAHHAGKNARIALAALDECKVYGRAFRRAVNAIQAATSDEATGAKALECVRYHREWMEREGLVEVEGEPLEVECDR